MRMKIARSGLATAKPDCKVFIYFQDEIHPNIRKIQCSRNKIGSPLTVR